MTVIAQAHTDAAPPEKVAEWRAMVEAWDCDHSQPDPYAETEISECIRVSAAVLI
jgi:hypothetical protein